MPLRRYESNNKHGDAFYNVMSLTVVHVKHQNKLFAKNGGGVIIHYSGYVLTTEHLIRSRGGSSYYVSRKDDPKVYNAVLVDTIDPKYDDYDCGYGLLKIVGCEGIDFDYAGVATNQLPFAHEVLSIGYPLGSKFNFSLGIINEVGRMAFELIDGGGNEALKIIFFPETPNIGVIVQSSRLGSYGDGLSQAEGCPLFNWSGEVIAVFGFCLKYFDIGYPVCANVIENWIELADKGDKDKEAMSGESNATKSITSSSKKQRSVSAQEASSRFRKSQKAKKEAQKAKAQVRG